MSNCRWICVGLVGTALCSLLRTVSADEVANKALPAAVKRVLALLPEDTETILATQNFILRPMDDAIVDDRDFCSSLCQIPLLEFCFFDEMKFDLLARAQRKVVLAVRAGRNFEDFPMGGFVRSDGCMVVVFEKDLGDLAKEWTAGVRRGAKEVRERAGHEVFVIGEENGDEKLEMYLAVLDPNTILCASSYEYLCKVLDRARVPSPKRALPDSLPAWKHIDSAAPYWMLRQVPETQKGRLIDSVVYSVNSAKVQVTFLPRADSEDGVENRIRDYTDIGPKRKLKVQINRSGDGTVTLSTSVGKLDEAEHSFYGHLLYHLQAEDGSVQMTPWGDLRRQFRTTD